jgi:hypothetical protein
VCAGTESGAKKQVVFRATCVGGQSERKFYLRNPGLSLFFFFFPFFGLILVFEFLFYFIIF